MNLIVYDLEWNNAGRIKSDTFGDYHKCPNEIIEIGAVKLDDTLEIIDSFSTCIKPVIYGNILDKRLIEEYDFDYKELEKGLPFTDAVKGFMNWIGSDYLLCTWGTDDMVQLKTNCNYFNINIEWITKSLNIQRCYMRTKGIAENKQISLENALKEQSICIDTRLHRALNDAIFTAKLFKTSCKDEYTKSSFLYEENAYRPRINVDISTLKLDNSKLRPKCPYCGRYAKVIGSGIKHNKIEKLAHCSQCDIDFRQRTKINVYNDGEMEYRISSTLINI